MYSHFGYSWCGGGARGCVQAWRSVQRASVAVRDCGAGAEQRRRLARKQWRSGARIPADQAAPRGAAEQRARRPAGESHAGHKRNNSEDRELAAEERREEPQPTIGPGAAAALRAFFLRAISGQPSMLIRAGGGVGGGGIGRGRPPRVEKDAAGCLGEARRRPRIGGQRGEGRPGPGPGISVCIGMHSLIEAVEVAVVEDLDHAVVVILESRDGHSPAIRVRGGGRVGPRHDLEQAQRDDGVGYPLCKATPATGSGLSEARDRRRESAWQAGTLLAPPRPMWKNFHGSMRFSERPPNIWQGRPHSGATPLEFRPPKMEA